MPWMPWQTLDLELGVPIDEARSRLESLVGAPDLLGHDLGQDPQRRPFHGTIGSNEVRFRRMLPWYFGNPFLPEIRGRLEADGERTRIRLRMALTPFIGIFVLVWMSMATVAVFAGLGDALQGKGWESLCPPAFLWIAGYMLVTASFSVEAGIARRLLRKLETP